MAIPLCQMISMSVVHHAFKIDIFKMEQVFQTGYREGIKFFMFHLSIIRGKRNSKNSTCLLGVGIGCLRMRYLSLFFLVILTSSRSLGTFFFVQDGNHKLQAWLPYINHMHNDEPSWHIFVDSIVLNTSHELVELLIATIEFNKYVLDLLFFPLSQI